MVDEFRQIYYLSIYFLLMLRPSLTMVGNHIKCRLGIYPRSTINRFPVPDDKVNWAIEYKNYDPPYYTSPSVMGKPWADPEIGDSNFKPKWNSLDDKISRDSHIGTYKIVDGFPHNPIGRTGIRGRGVLGRWGPNHAADPIVTRWKKLPNGEVEHDKNNKFVISKVDCTRALK